MAFFLIGTVTENGGEQYINSLVEGGDEKASLSGGPCFFPLLVSPLSWYGIRVTRGNFSYETYSNKRIHTISWCERVDGG